MDMYNWIDRVIYGEKKPLPVLTYPAAQLLCITVKELVESSSYQSMGMRLIADRYNMPAALAYMDLSVEAEAFGAHTVYGVDEVPTIIGKLVSGEEDADKLAVPEVGAGRTGVCVDTIRKACKLIHDRPVIAGCIGPFSLAGRLMNVNDIMVSCYTDPDTVHKVLKKATAFIIKYIKALKTAGASGVMMAEPLAGLLSPELMQEFSSDYVKRIVAEVQDKHFIVVYHNCGSAVNQLTDEIISTGCRAYHFGERADMELMLSRIPENCLVMGNISPSAVFNNNTPEEMRRAVIRLLDKCAGHPNFILSSGCDIPPYTDFDNVDMFFQTAADFAYRQQLWDIIA
ncbi:MAG: uroporphyrinogen decarboxylase family protein [Candidatus Heteroscillospira sp.]|jgi:uroporphyrinogen decarboxylase